jgi:hypothetical protein
MPVAVRAYAPPPASKKRRRYRGQRWKPLEPSEYTVVFDCETTSDTAQALRFGAFQVRKGIELYRAGLFQDVDGLSALELEVLRAYCDGNDLELLDRSEFVDDVFYRYVADLGGICVGFNLPFDISRIAIGHVQGRGAHRNAFSFDLSEDPERDRVRVHHRSANSSRIEFVRRGRQRRQTDHPGHFINVKTIARALTGSSHSLASLGDHLETEHRKLDADEHGGPLTPEYVRYGYIDVQVTWECYQDLAARYRSYALTGTPLTQIMSEAGIGKASLREMGIRPWRTVQPDFPDELIGQIMSTYSGGRAEVGLRKEIAEVAYCDFKSMYPSVCALQNLWRYVIAQGIDHEDATDDVRALLDGIELEHLQDPGKWGELVAIVEVRPEADIFPVRCQYGAGEQYGLAQSYLSSSTGETFWFTLADCIASKLRTGRSPDVVCAIRFRPRDPQEGLRPFDIAGNPDCRVNPYTDDFYTRLIELRTETKARGDNAKREGNNTLAGRLEGEQQSLKITANATSYGIFIELNPRELDKVAHTACYGLDGQRFDAQVRRYETPGRHFHPLLATLITGAARLMLTLAQLLAHRHGIDWAFCDTDSLALMRPNVSTRDVFHADIDAVRRWFRELSPYRNASDIFELEDTNYRLKDRKKTSEREPLYCYAISPKRYALFNIDADGSPVIRKGSAHGLGHLMSPFKDADAPTEIPAPIVPARELELARWQYDLWYLILEAALNGTVPDFAALPGFGRPAMASCSVTTPAVLKWFRQHNAPKPYAHQTRPFGFFNTPSVRPFEKPLGKVGQSFHLVAPYQSDANQWLESQYVDIYSGDAFRISTDTYTECLAKVQTYSEHATRYQTHPDAKKHGHDGKPCRQQTVGRLGARHIDAFHVEQIGKEADRLEEVEAGLTHEPGEVYTLYEDAQRDTWRSLVAPVLEAMPMEELLAAGVLKGSALREYEPAGPAPMPLRAQGSRHSPRITLESSWVDESAANRIGNWRYYMRTECSFHMSPPLHGVQCADRSDRRRHRSTAALPASSAPTARGGTKGDTQSPPTDRLSFAARAARGGPIREPSH